MCCVNYMAQTAIFEITLTSDEFFVLEFPGPLYQNEAIFPLTQIELIFTIWPHFESESFWNSKVGYVFQFFDKSQHR